jgi:hypothetical protein
MSTQSIIAAATKDATASIGQQNSVWGPSTLHLALVGAGSAALIVRNDVLEIHRRNLSWAADGTLDIPLGSLQGVVAVQLRGMSTTGSATASLISSATESGKFYGTAAEILATTPGTEFAEGFPSDQPVLMKWSRSSGWNSIPLSTPISH